VQTLTLTHSDDAQALLDAIGRLKGFRKKAKQQILEGLEDQGFLDRRAPLTPEALTHHVQHRLRDALSEGTTTLQAIDVFAAYVRGVVGREAGQGDQGGEVEDGVVVG